MTDNYLDYFIKDGKFIGKFEEMYQNCDDPWKQTVKEENASDKAIVLNLVNQYKPKKIIEIGCGFGLFTNKLATTGSEVLGIDVSETAIHIAKQRYPNCRFQVSDISNYTLYERFDPDLFIMAEVTWCILDKLDAFKSYLKRNHKGKKLIHLITLYKGENYQKYGKEYFTTTDEVMRSFDLDYIQWGEVHNSFDLHAYRSFFLGEIK